MKNTTVKILVCLLLLLFCISGVSVYAEETVSAPETQTPVYEEASETPEPKESEPVSFTGSYTSYGLIIPREYTFSEDYFRLPSDKYNHDLAKLSLGMALSAFRDILHPEKQDNDLIAFLEGMGFDQIETDTYRSDPTAYSVAYGIGQLQLDDMTVVALAVCGGNYEAEWASNLTIGNEVRAAGFQDAAQKVQKGLKDYLEHHPAGDNAKLWITGYSRGGAVANITAADCTDSRTFKDIYAYTFASPRTTKEPGKYRSIFNIVQKNDIVPKIPLADWGYQRYGTDLFLVSPEIDMDREAVFMRAEALYREMVGTVMVRNYEINYQLRVLLDYLYLILNNSADYTEYLQPLLLDILTRDDETKDALQVLMEALQRFSVEDVRHREELEAMMDYLQTLINIYYLQDGIGQLPPDQWDPQFGIDNLFNDHLPFKYLAMMLASDNPEELFSDRTNYVRLVIYGEVDAEIREGDRLLKTVLADGTELVEGVEAPGSPPYVDASEGKIVITLPADRSFTVSICSKSFPPQTVTYTGLLFSGNTVRAGADDLYSFLMMKDDTATILTSSNGKAIEPEGSDFTDVSAYVETIYSPTTAMRLENNSVMHLTISGLVNKILLILVFLIVQGIVSLILTVIRKKKNRKRNVLVALIWHGVIAVVFAILEVAMWYFVPILTLAKFIPGALVFIVISVYAVKGYLEYRRNLKACIILIAALAAYVILESLLIGEFALWKGILLIAVYIVFMLACYQFLWNTKEENLDTTARTE